MNLDRRTFLLGTAGLAVNPWRFIQNQPTVKVRQGTLQGSIDYGVNIFKGIPFAAPPIGDLRFKLAQPAKPWSGTRDATKNAPSAMQSGNGDSEDCLYLNIFAPTESRDCPVLFWIHGGGNTGGGTAGQSPGSFAQQGIIVVTIAYRLGAFGYLPLQQFDAELESSGVNGIQDLVAALKWIKENIEAFGGNPDQVTISGQSAGAKNVAAIMATPNAKGLFHRAIMHSGSGLTVHSPEQGKEVTSQFLNVNNLTTSDLRIMTAKALLDSQQRFAAEYRRNFPFRPTIGSEYLPNIPATNIQANVPLILGTCLDESISFINRNTVNDPIQPRAVSHNTAEQMNAIEALYQQISPEDSLLKRRIKSLTAQEYWIPSIRHAEAHSANGAKTWMYRFEHKNDESLTPHGADMEYVWNARPGWTLHETLVNFIKGKSPRDWPTYDAETRSTLIFNQNGSTSVVKDPSATERKLWEGTL